MERFTTPEPMILDADEVEALSRADLVFLGVDHSGPTYEARIYFNNPDAALHTPTDAEHGYAGSFFIFGHGTCYGEEGHCDRQQRYVDVFDQRPPHPITPIARTVIVTEAVERVGGGELTVTLVAVDATGAEAAASDALAFEELRLLVYED